MTITEPTTMITDYVLTVITVIAAVKLLRRNSGERCVVYLAASLLLIGVAAATGGTYHGFRMMMPDWAVTTSWKATMTAIGMGSLCFALAAAYQALYRRARVIVVALFVTKLVFYLVWIAWEDDFRYAIYEYTPTMIFVVATEVYLWMKERNAAAPWIIAGIAVSSVAAMIQAAGRGFHEHFNHNDIYHVVQMAGIYLFYRGGLRLADRISEEPADTTRTTS